MDCGGAALELLLFCSTQRQIKAARKFAMRVINVAAAQMGPIQRADSGEVVVKRMLALMDEAKAGGADLIVYPELALTTFFPRWYMEDQAEVDAWFEQEMPNAATKPLFERAARHQMAMSFGYAELTPEERYFEPGDLGFNVWRALGGIFGMAVCNDRRWPETYRVMGLQGVEMVLIGYNTPSVNAEKSEEGPRSGCSPTGCRCRRVPTKIRHGSCASPRPVSKMVTP